MRYSNKTSSTLLISAARLDARRSVSKWRWGVLGICLSFLPIIGVISLCVVLLVVYILIPKIDLSTSEKVELYSQHPALYTVHYRKTAKTVRVLSCLFGWIFGALCIVFLF